MLNQFRQSPPERVCVVRLSALGDACHTLAVVRSLQAHWPGTRFTWLIGRHEHRLLSLAEDVEFITVDKKAGLRGYRALARALGGRRFDLSLHMQVALRASLYGALVRSPVRLGFDRARAREGQWLFTTDRIAAEPRVHVLDGLMGFARALGVEASRPVWNLVPPEQAVDYARALIPDGARALVISACSSHAARNWSAERYAAVADHAVARHGLKVILAGGPSEVERRMASDIVQRAREPLTNQVGKDTLPELLALLSRAEALVTPDSGPAHMATMVGLPVVGLYAATNPARSGPYLSRAHCIDRFAEAAERFLGRPAGSLPWTTKIELPGVMDLIQTGDVTAKLDELVARGGGAARLSATPNRESTWPNC